MKNPPTPGSVASPRPPGPVTRAWLERVALHYLDRHAASTQMLRRTLARRIDRRARARDEDPADFADLIEPVVAWVGRAGLVDDARFAASRLARLRRRGTSTRAAGAALTAKGLPRDTVEAALDDERRAGGETADEADTARAVEIEAARAYARRRRLGPHRPEAARAETRARDLAAMGRAGFAYGIAAAVIDAGRDEGADDRAEGEAEDGREA